MISRVEQSLVLLLRTHVYVIIGCEESYSIEREYRVEPELRRTADMCLVGEVRRTGEKRRRGAEQQRRGHWWSGALLVPYEQMSSCPSILPTRLFLSLQEFFPLHFLPYLSRLRRTQPPQLQRGRALVGLSLPLLGNRLIGTSQAQDRS